MVMWEAQERSQYAFVLEQDYLPTGGVETVNAVVASTASVHTCYQASYAQQPSACFESAKAPRPICDWCILNLDCLYEPDAMAWYWRWPIHMGAHS